MESTESQKVQAIEKLYADDRKLLMRLYSIVDLYYRKYFPRKDLAETGVDIVNGILEVMLTGERSWDIKKYPDAFNQILYYLSSELQNLKTVEEKNIEALHIDSPRLSKKDQEALKNATVVTMDENFEKKNIYIMFEKCSKYIKDKGDPLEAKIFEGMYCKKTNKEIAEENDVDITEVENKKKKIKRNLRSKFPGYKM